MKVRWFAAASLPVVLLAGAIGAQAFVLPPVAPLSAYEAGTQGAGAFASTADELGLGVRNVVSDWAVLPRGNGTLLVVLGVPTQPTESDLAHLASFVQSGGQVMVFDDVGYGGEFGHDHGVLFHRVELKDDRFVRNRSLVRTTLELSADRFPLILNRPTALLIQPDAQGEVWARSSNDSFLDINADGVVGVEDRSGPFDLAFATPPNDGGGRWIFVADADPFTDGSLAFAENRAALGAVLALLLPEGGTVLFDERGRSTDTFDAAGQRLLAQAVGIAATPWARILLAIAPVGALLLARRLPPSEIPSHRLTLDAPRPAPLPDVEDVELRPRTR